MSETRDLQRIEARLVERFASSVDRAEVRRELFAAYHEFDEAPIRSYVLILTERVATARLSAPTPPAAHARHVVVGASA